MKQKGQLTQSNSYLYYRGDKPSYNNYKKFLNKLISEDKADFEGIFIIHTIITNKYMLNKINNRLYEYTEPKTNIYSYDAFLSKFDTIILNELNYLVKLLKKMLRYKLQNKPTNLI